jgi:hypothetical protein
MMAGLAETIGKRVLKRKTRGFQREVQVQNFDTAKSAAVVFDTSETDSFPVIKDFRKFLVKKGIKCRVYGYVPQKEIPQEMLFWKHYSFITHKDLTWYMKPKGEAAESFYNFDPDILFDFTRDVPLEMQFLVRLSRARFKVGCFTEEENDYDLMINMTGRCDIGYFSEQVKHYISMLNPSNKLT